jgi:pilus assembly protein CpaF
MVLEGQNGWSAETVATDAVSELKRRAQDALFARLGVRLFDSTLTEEQLQAFVAQEITELMSSAVVPLSVAERHRLVVDIIDDVVGLGPLERLLADDSVSEVMVNSTDPIYVERDGVIAQTETRFVSVDHLRRVIERIVAQVGRRIDESSPMVDARLPDGSRINAVIPPLAVDGPVLTVRKFSRDALDIEDLIRLATLNRPVADLLAACVRGGLTVLVSGGTGTGKTTFLNALSSFVPEDERIVTIEDAVELQLNQRHVIRLESRPPNIEGRGEVTIRDLVRNALRMRPDRIIVGEVRGVEALDMLQAMNTGHDGSLSTIHANGARDALARLETMVLMAGMDLPTRAIREQMVSALHLVVHLHRFRDGSRRVTQVSEVVGLRGEEIVLTDIFAVDYAAGFGVDGRFQGELWPTGARPTFADHLVDLGVGLPESLFGEADPFAPRERW